MITLTKDNRYIAELIQWDSAGLCRLKGEVEKIEKPYNHFHIFFKGEERYYPIHEKSVEEFNKINPQPQKTAHEIASEGIQKLQTDNLSNDYYYGDIVELVTKQEPNEVISVQSSHANTVYLVAPQQQTCTCKGFQYRHHCKHLHQVNGQQLAKIASDYGYEVSISENSFSIYEWKFGKRQFLLNINFDKDSKTYWYRPNQNFSNPVEAFKKWAIANYKKPKLSKRIKLAS